MILVVGLSPAWQRTLEFERMNVGEVNRARRVMETASGKGVNVARVAHTLGAPVQLLTVAGGHRGDLLAQSLRAQKLSSRIVRVQAETRVCQTIISHDVTELVEETGPLHRVEVAEVFAVFTGALLRAKLLVLVGTVPPGCGEDFYERLVRQAARSKVRVLVDAQKAQLLNVVRAEPWLVRVNRNELKAATGAMSVADGVRLLQQRGAQAVVISCGPGGVTAFQDGEHWTVQPPPIKAVNPIGSGDAMLAGIATALYRGESLREALQLGVACGSANALTPTAGCIRRADVRRLLRS